VSLITNLLEAVVTSSLGAALQVTSAGPVRSPEDEQSWKRRLSRKQFPVGHPRRYEEKEKYQENLVGEANTKPESILQMHGYRYSHSTHEPSFNHCYWHSHDGNTAIAHFPQPPDGTWFVSHQPIEPDRHMPDSHDAEALDHALSVLASPNLRPNHRST